jgi:16S rRNA (cytidine1402-2'-O)-methyltransferase
MITSEDFGVLHLIPTPLGKVPPEQSLPESVLSVLHQLSHFAVEQVRSSISFLHAAKHPQQEFELKFYQLPKPGTDSEILMELLQLMLEGTSVGLLSDAGCPGVADPGNELVKLAHSSGIRVIPHIGPASMILALMASGFNGQKFRFNGYLKRDHQGRNEQLKELEKSSLQFDQTELFMEAPQRNTTLLKDAISGLMNETQLLMACNLSLPDELIISKKVADWKRVKLPDIDKKPCIFGIFSESGYKMQPKDKGKIATVKRW